MVDYITGIGSSMCFVACAERLIIAASSLLHKIYMGPSIVILSLLSYIKGNDCDGEIPHHPLSFNFTFVSLSVLRTSFRTSGTGT